MFLTACVSELKLIFLDIVAKRGTFGPSFRHSFLFVFKRMRKDSVSPLQGENEKRKRKRRRKEETFTIVSRRRNTSRFVFGPMVKLAFLIAIGYLIKDMH